MGQKVHPIGFRLGVTKTWSAQWYADKDYTKLLQEDLRIRKLIDEKLAAASISKVEIERGLNYVTVTVHSAKPGVVIGKGGQNVEVLRAAIGEISAGKVKLEIKEIRQPDLDAFLVAAAIGGQLTRRIAFRKALKQGIQRTMKAGAKGVKVITVDGDVNRSLFPDARPYYIGTDNVVGGRLLGQAAKKLLESRGKTSGGYVQFAGFTDNDNARKRMDGFREAVGSAFEERDRMPDEMDLTKARNNVRTALVNHPDLAALVGIWAYNAPAIAEVTEERGIRDQVTIVTFDAQAAALQHMADGKIDAMVVQNPFEMGILAVRLLLAMHTDDETTIKQLFPRHGEPDGDIHTTGLRLIAPDAGSPLKADDFQVEGIEFFPLSKFRAWLETYGLSSS